MALIPEHLIDRIRESIDIVEVISRYISLRKQGRNYIALCPFHTEKTPSFTVSPEKQIFYCFGCHTGGNVFNFLMHYEKISFIEAVKKLADETGIELPRPESRDSLVTSEYDYLYRANQFAADFYHQMLDKHYNEIENYLSSRNLKESTLKFFKIGYAPTKWDLLYQEILQKKLNLSPFLKCGLIIESEKDSSRKFDRFRNRVSVIDYSFQFIISLEGSLLLVVEHFLMIHKPLNILIHLSLLFIEKARYYMGCIIPRNGYDRKNSLFL